MQGVNGSNWDLMAPILANPLIQPDMAAILSARGYFLDLLEIRKDSSLFRLRTGRRIHEANNAIELVGKMARQPAPA